MDLILLHLLATNHLIDPSHSREYLLCLIHRENTYLLRIQRSRCEKSKHSLDRTTFKKMIICHTARQIRNQFKILIHVNYSYFGHTKQFTR